MTKAKKPKSRLTKPDKELQEVYDRVRRDFSAADLQKFTVIEPMVPAQKVLAEMENIHRQYLATRKKNVAARKKRRLRHAAAGATPLPKEDC